MFYRVEFSKTDRARFLGHRDLMKVMVQGMRRAGFDLALTQGFNPRPKVSFGPALAVGISSQAEYFDVELEQQTGAGDFLRRLNECLPEGFAVSRVMETQVALPSLGLLNLAYYQAWGLLQQPCDIKNSIKAFGDAEEVSYERSGRDGLAKRNIKEGVLWLRGKEKGDGFAILEFALTLGNKGAVRPGEVLGPLGNFGLNLFQESIRIHRTGLYFARGEKLFSPLEDVEE